MATMQIDSMLGAALVARTGQQQQTVTLEVLKRQAAADGALADTLSQIAAGTGGSADPSRGTTVDLRV